ncbi:hypothetical protein A1QS_10730 [Vibrio ordalii FS-238]|uniref:PRD domain-containing protein n=2 Tax=Vibrio ordalii TaxID=28174 RepID=A0A853R250_9VIBR|nr:hypothetical protein A1QS_10730 [Vibrio ordalii FS-238]
MLITNNRKRTDMEQRLALLLHANVISQRAYDGCLQVLAMMDRQLGLSHDNEQYQMALTHLSRAADRIWQGEAVAEGLDSELLDEIYDDPGIQSVIDIHQKTLNAMSLSTVPATEESFLIANIYALYLAAQHDETQE